METWMIMVVVLSFITGVFYYYLPTGSTPRLVAIGTLVLVLAFIPGDGVGFNLLKYVLMFPSLLIGSSLAYLIHKRRHRPH